MNEKSWVEKYRPEKYSEIRGQEVTIQKVKSFIEDFKARDKKSLILYGPPGTGKTTIAHVSAKETGSEIFELNASDLRNKASLAEILKPAIEQRPLFKQNKIILVDEVDGISKVDWGGLTELESLLELSQIPVIITANDIWDKKFNIIRK